jgi:hypothetical protein
VGLWLVYIAMGVAYVVLMWRAVKRGLPPSEEVLHGGDDDEPTESDTDPSERIPALTY